MSEPRRFLGYFLFAFGLVLLIASLFADPLALGMPGSGFGWKQLLGTMTGIVLLTVGVIQLREPFEGDDRR